MVIAILCAVPFAMCFRLVVTGALQKLQANEPTRIYDTEADHRRLCDCFPLWRYLRVYTT